MREAALNSLSKTSVLIVEDDPSARIAIARLLSRRGYAVSEASTVAAALAALVNVPMWILLDLMLPDGCGIDILRAVRSRSLGSKVCLITGCSSHVVDEAQREGVEHTFIKPLDVERLMMVLQS
jgi:ActR/RegA family two-component response regulator